MENEAIKGLALQLLRADSEDEVIEILSSAGFWDNWEAWRLYGDKEGNFAQAGNQQSLPEAALVEKCINSVDTRLMLECLTRGIKPESEAAPSSVRDAVATFFEDRRSPDDNAGTLVNWSAARRTEESRNITICATGGQPTQGRKSKKMCLTIADRGEGQSPLSVSRTILSLNAKNKQRIKFVQGKFNMGGSGALRFCGRRGLQLVITKRDPRIADSNDPTSDQWAVTVVRREQPTNRSGEPIHSEFTYLAPIASRERPRQGDVMGFTADSLALMPIHDEPYAEEIRSGTAIKLYEYETTAGQSNILMKNGLLFALERLMPEVALPIRLHECREYEGVKERSFETPLAGLVVRLEDGRGDNLEPNFPKSAQIRCEGMEMTARIYAFKEDKAKTYLKDEGVIFAVNGQAHGYLPKSIFQRPRAVGLPRLRDSLLVLVDCSKLSAIQREDLFMTSRDRLSKNPLRYALEQEIESILKNHKDLKRLQQERHQEALAEQLKEDQPLEDVISKVLRSSPTLSALFLKGQRLSRPFQNGTRMNGTSGTKGGGRQPSVSVEFKGKRHPTFFRIADVEYGRQYNRTCEEGRRCRVRFVTDVENEYFDRATDSGKFELEILDDDSASIENYAINLEDGSANLSFALPEGAKAGDTFLIQATVSDSTLGDPFVNVVRLSVVEWHEHKPGARKRNEKKQGDQEGDAETHGGISLPHTVVVRENDANWSKYGFDPETACHVESDPSKEDESKFEHTFYINLDNRALQNEMKHSTQHPHLLEAKFKTANVMFGLAMLQDYGKEDRDAKDEEDGVSPQDEIRKFTSAVAPFVIPMVDQLGGLEESEVVYRESGD